MTIYCIQGQKRDALIISSIQPMESVKKNYTHYELSGSSDLFDPGQYNRWEDKQRQSLLFVEADLLPLSGQWQKETHDLSGIESAEKSLSFLSSEGGLSLNWSHDGTLLGWQVAKGPIKLSAKLRSLPSKTSFGEIIDIDLDEDISEKDL